MQDLGCPVFGGFQPGPGGSSLVQQQQQHPWPGGAIAGAFPQQHYQTTARHQPWQHHMYNHNQQRLSQIDDVTSNQVQQILANVEQLQQEQQLLTLSAATAAPQNSAWVQANAKAGPAACRSLDFPAPVAFVPNGKVLLGPGVQPALARQQQQMCLQQQQQQQQQQQRCVYTIAADAIASAPLSPLPVHLEAVMDGELYQVS